MLVNAWSSCHNVVVADTTLYTVVSPAIKNLVLAGGAVVAPSTVSDLILIIALSAGDVAIVGVIFNEVFVLAGEGAIVYTVASPAIVNFVPIGGAAVRPSTVRVIPDCDPPFTKADTSCNPFTKGVPDNIADVLCILELSRNISSLRLIAFYEGNLSRVYI